MDLAGNGQCVQILGAGAAGLSAGYFARKNDIEFRINEASSEIGGNAVTFRSGDFLYDSGAHRWHDKDPEMTREIQVLLGERLRRISIPSRIYHSRRFVDFPLSPLNLIRNLGVLRSGKACTEIISSRLGRRSCEPSFESFALHTYGPTIANRFLLNYSEKLWGTPCRNLSPDVAGKRMKGLNLKTFLKESMGGSHAKTEHLDGSFYYPDQGIGSITDAIADYCGRENIASQSRVTRVLHDGKRIIAIEINGREFHSAGFLVNTIPLPHFLGTLDPLPPEAILALSRRLRFRHLRLVALFLNTDSITHAATVYFPEAEFPFTRLYEPKNRSLTMAPPGKTSIVVEVSCQQEDAIWNCSEREIVDSISDTFIRLGWIRKDQIIGSAVHSMAYAYPILEKGFEKNLKQIRDYLGKFKNLALSGRGGEFRYTHLHDMMRAGKSFVERYQSALSVRCD